MSKDMNGLLRDVYDEATGALKTTTPAGGGTVGLTDAQLRATPVPVAGTLVRIDDTAFARPANTTAYAAKDVISADPSTIRTFTNAARASGGTGYITKALVMTSDSAQTARLRLHLYNTSSPTVLDDNVANTVLAANRAKYVGPIDFPALQTETGSTEAFSLVTGIAIGFTTVGNRNLFGVLETLDAFTPVSASTWAVSIWADQN